MAGGNLNGSGRCLLLQMDNALQDALRERSDITNSVKVMLCTNSPGPLSEGLVLVDGR